MTTPANVREEIRTLYHETTPATVERDLRRAIGLLKSLDGEAERARRRLHGRSVADALGVDPGPAPGRQEEERNAAGPWAT